jgi:hypothetical protein
MAYSNIIDPSAHFQTAIYTGNGDSSDDTNAITNDGNSDLQPDFIWLKRRDYDNGYQLIDSSRGVDKFLGSETTAAETTLSGRLASFDTDGFTVQSSSGAFNAENEPFVAWQWKANGGTTSTNNDGDVTSTVQVNQDAGFSIITDGPHANTNARTIGHGLGKKPTFIIRFNRTRIENKPVFFQGFGTYGGINIDGEGTNHTSTTHIFTDNFTSSVFSVGTDFRINGNYPYITWCFTDVQGYSKSGSYKGNGNVSGPFVYTGFKPAWVIIKANSNYKYWNIFDNKRNPYNGVTTRLAPSIPNAEDTVSGIDFLSNGFKLRDGTTTLNESGTTIAYFAMAENPFVAGGVPTTAR